MYKELIEGKQIELHDKQMKIGNNAFPRLTIMYHVRDWNYMCRWHDEIIPRERNV